MLLVMEPFLRFSCIFGQQWWPEIIDILKQSSWILVTTWCRNPQTDQCLDGYMLQAQRRMISPRNRSTTILHETALLARWLCDCIYKMHLQTLCFVSILYNRWWHSLILVCRDSIYRVTFSRLRTSPFNFRLVVLDTSYIMESIAMRDTEYAMWIYVDVCVWTENITLVLATLELK